MPRIFRTTVLLLLSTWVIPAFAQLDVYKTYDDYVNKNPKSYPAAKYEKYKGQENSTIVFDRGGSDELELECASIWGFEYGGGLFRVSKESKYFSKKADYQLGAPFMVTHHTDVVLYENGLYYLEAMKKGKNEVYMKGMCGAVSKDLDSPMAVVPCGAWQSTDEQLVLWVSDYPELKDLADQIAAKLHRKFYGKEGALDLPWMRMTLTDREKMRKDKGQ